MRAHAEITDVDLAGSHCRQFRRAGGELHQLHLEPFFVEIAVVNRVEQAAHTRDMRMIGHRNLFCRRHRTDGQQHCRSQQQGNKFLHGNISFSNDG